MFGLTFATGLSGCLLLLSALSTATSVNVRETVEDAGREHFSLSMTPIV